MIDKNDPGKENRTFETRLLFIKSIFDQMHSKEEVLASSIQFKLNKTYEQYVSDLNKCINYLKNKDTDKVIQKL